MFAELSFRKLFFMGLVITTLCMAAGVTYALQKEYLGGFSVLYYSTMLRNAFVAQLYRVEYSRGRGLDTTASFFSALAFGPSETLIEPPTGVAGAIPVLLYHGVINRDDNSYYSVTMEQFKEHMFALKRAGYETVPMDQFREFLEGTRSLPERSFVLTFDDGRKDSFYNADPVLQALEYEAVMFVSTGKSIGTESLRSTYYLGEWELRNMLGTGRWEIESHGRSAAELAIIDAQGTEGYFYSNKLWLADRGRLETDEEFGERVRGDLVSSRHELEQELQTSVTALAFPFGEFGQESVNFPEAKNTVSELARSAYPLSFYQFRVGDRFAANYPRSDQERSIGLFLKRLEVVSDWTAERVVQLLDQVSAKPLPFEDAGQYDAGWTRMWGDIAFTTQGVTMRPSSGTTGSAMTLDGSRLWRDYSFHTRVIWQGGNSFYLWARFQDDENFAACNFSRIRVHVEQSYEGQFRVIRGVDREIAVPEGPIDIGIRVAGRRVECLVNNELIVASDFLEPALSSGGIGIKIWDPDPDASRVLVERVSVEPVTIPAEPHIQDEDAI